MAAKKLMINYLGWHASLINRYNRFYNSPSKPEEAAKIIKKIISNEKYYRDGKNNYFLGKKFLIEIFCMKNFVKLS